MRNAKEQDEQDGKKSVNSEIDEFKLFYLKNRKKKQLKINE